MRKKTYNWISLEEKNSEIMSSLILRWEDMLNSNLRELEYHKFINDHAGFFFGNYNCYLTISKLKLGSDYETDFVNVIDQRSNGIIYEFIEIEKPSSRLFSSNGIPTKDFNNAIQQIRDWKRYLIENKAWFRKYLPSQTTRIINNAGVTFTLIIGKRTDNPLEIEKRNQIADELRINIRSFDYLTDLFKRRKFFNQASPPVCGCSFAVFEHNRRSTRHMFNYNIVKNENRRFKTKAALANDRGRISLSATKLRAKRGTTNYHNWHFKKVCIWDSRNRTTVWVQYANSQSYKTKWKDR